MPENRLLAALPAHERERLTPFLEPVSLNFNQVLVEFERPIEYAYFLDTAVTSTVVRTPDGDSIEVGLMGAEGFVGLSLVYGVKRSESSRARAAERVTAPEGLCLYVDSSASGWRP